MRICNFGSLNIDVVCRVPRIARPGETLASAGVTTFAGGKGANQSVALARAGAHVAHAGAVGPDGAWLIDKLGRDGVDVSPVRVIESARTGHAYIQVDDAGENAIVLEAGANHALTREQIDRTLSAFSAGDVLLLQNETNELPYLIEAGRQRGLTVCFNPAPMSAAVHDYPLDAVDLLIVNETEGEALSGERDPQRIAETLQRRCGGEVIVTLGAQGALHHGEHGPAAAPGQAVQVVDTTAAGDTFIGYYLAALVTGLDVRERLARACAAAALCCTRAGAIDAIPRVEEVVT